MEELLLKRIKLIDSRLKEEDVRLDLYSTLIPYILSKNIFRNNKEIKEFIDLLSLEKKLKSYVYNTRTQIAARLCREIQKSDRDRLLHNAKVLKNHALNLEINTYTKNNTTYEKNKKSIIDVLNKYSRNK